MSKAGLITIGIVTGLMAIAFAYLGVTYGQDFPRGPLPVYGLSAFCGVIALACFAQRSRPLTVRIIGGVIFAAFLWYAYSTYGDRDFIRALAGFVALGLPGAYVAITGKYPSWDL